ncbi:MAG: hypothetical protein GWN58_58825, partial [Anaerolineae bacterium]|nr:hypothetical protein [Anaerolineae bacterium]
PAELTLTWPVVLFLLLVPYLATGVGVVLPLVVLGRIIRRTKEAEMETLQAQLDDLLPRVRELSKEE